MDEPYRTFDVFSPRIIFIQNYTEKNNRDRKKYGIDSKI